MFGSKKIREDLPEDSLRGILAIRTPKFQEFMHFFKVLGFEIISSEGDQLCPLFGKQQAARILLEGWEINLEEDSSMLSAPVFNFQLLTQKLEEDLKRAAVQLLDYEIKEGLYGRFYTFFSPDGGSVVIEVKDWMPEIIGWLPTKTRCEQGAAGNPLPAE